MLHLRRIQRNRRRFHQKVQIQVAHLVHLERPPSHQRRDLDSVEDQHEIALREACVCPSVSILCSDHDLHLDLKADRYIADEDYDACDYHCYGYGCADYACDPNQRMSVAL